MTKGGLGGLVLEAKEKGREQCTFGYFFPVDNRLVRFLVRFRSTHISLIILKNGKYTYFW